jgi:hypothetical protein
MTIAMAATHYNKITLTKAMTTIAMTATHNSQITLIKAMTTIAMTGARLAMGAVLRWLLHEGVDKVTPF